MKNIFFTLLISLISSGLYGQARPVKHLRLGVRIGAPNVFTGHIEYVTHFWEDHIAFSADFMSLSPTIDDVKLNYTEFEIGSNIYFNANGNGLYGGISYFNFDGTGSYADIEFDDGSFGAGSGDLAFNTLNLKLGFKAGRHIYFRTEVGYGFGNIPEQIIVKGSNGQVAVEDIPDVIGIGASGLIIFNIGFGCALF